MFTNANPRLIASSTFLGHLYQVIQRESKVIGRTLAKDEVKDLVYRIRDLPNFLEKKETTQEFVNLCSSVPYRIIQDYLNVQTIELASGLGVGIGVNLKVASSATDQQLASFFKLCKSLRDLVLK